jgi:hypothetical protein
MLTEERGIMNQGMIGRTIGTFLVLITCMLGLVNLAGCATATPSTERDTQAPAARQALKPERKTATQSKNRRNHAPEIVYVQGLSYQGRPIPVLVSSDSSARSDSQPGKSRNGKANSRRSRRSHPRVTLALPPVEPAETYSRSVGRSVVVLGKKMHVWRDGLKYAPVAVSNESFDQMTRAFAAGDTRRLVELAETDQWVSCR